jgi:hypothetical protein
MYFRNKNPEIENIRSVKIEVAGTAKYFLAILDMTRNLVSLCIKFHFSLLFFPVRRFTQKDPKEPKRTQKNPKGTQKDSKGTQKESKRTQKAT